MSIMNSVQSALSSSISDETTNRTNADTNLQNQINGKISWWASGNCVRLGNLQICWVYPTASQGGNTTFNVVLPQPFKNTDYVALVHQTGASPLNNATDTMTIMEKATTSFNVRKYATESFLVQVLCIGYWR